MQSKILPLFQSVMGSVVGGLILLIWPGLGVLVVGSATILIAFADGLALYEWVGPALLAVGFIVFGIHYYWLISRVKRLERVRQGRGGVATPEYRSEVERFQALLLRLEHVLNSRMMSSGWSDELTLEEIELFADLKGLGIDRPLLTTHDELAKYWARLARFARNATPATLDEARRVGFEM